MTLCTMDRILIALRSTRGRWLPIRTLATRASTTAGVARMNLDMLRDRGLVYEDTATTRSPRYLITQKGDEVADRLVSANQKASVGSRKTMWEHILGAEGSCGSWESSPP
jgi:predicted transcriptional regulator